MAYVPCRICTPVDRLARRIVHEIAINLEAPDAPDLRNRWTGKANQHSQHHESCPLERPFGRACLHSHSSLPFIASSPGTIVSVASTRVSRPRGIGVEGNEGMAYGAAAVSTAQAVGDELRMKTPRPARTLEQTAARAL